MGNGPEGLAVAVLGRPRFAAAWMRSPQHLFYELPVPVLVIGAGPTGLTVANELARHGVAVRHSCHELVDERTSQRPAEFSPQDGAVKARTRHPACSEGMTSRAGGYPLSKRRAI